MTLILPMNRLAAVIRLYAFLILLRPLSAFAFIYFMGPLNSADFSEMYWRLLFEIPYFLLLMYTARAIDQKKALALLLMGLCCILIVLDVPFGTFVTALIFPVFLNREARAWFTVPLGSSNAREKPVEEQPY